MFEKLKDKIIDVILKGFLVLFTFSAIFTGGYLAFNDERIIKETKVKIKNYINEDDQREIKELRKEIERLKSEKEGYKR